MVEERHSQKMMLRISFIPAEPSRRWFPAQLWDICKLSELKLLVHSGATKPELASEAFRAIRNVALVWNST
jgi:hypothetical protein